MNQTAQEQGFVMQRGNTEEEINTLELPKMVDNRLTIRGQCTTKTAGVCLVGECAHYDYYRAMKMSYSIDAENIQAEMIDGILTLTLPKRQLDEFIKKPISIKNGL